MVLLLLFIIIIIIIIIIDHLNFLEVLKMGQPIQKETVSNNKSVRPFGMRDKFGYLFGDFGNDFFFILVSSFLMVFYTDVFHISAATSRGTLYGCPLMGCYCRRNMGSFY